MNPSRRCPPGVLAVYLQLAERDLQLPPEVMAAARLGDAEAHWQTAANTHGLWNIVLLVSGKPVAVFEWQRAKDDAGRLVRTARQL